MERCGGVWGEMWRCMGRDVEVCGERCGGVCGEMWRCVGRDVVVCGERCGDVFGLAFLVLYISVPFHHHQYTNYRLISLLLL